MELAALKRRVELGSCGRPYGTPCTHERACIRCPMLSINPKMLPRLAELEEDLLARRKRAVAEDRRGEIDGLDLTLTFLQRGLREGLSITSTPPSEDISKAVYLVRVEAVAVEHDLVGAEVG
ncbi:MULTISPECIES: hypothetical protein [Streptomyces]|uniref:hypothetical protein n=1 Tax=Streptomyces TaxID=1883 RepID=UPI001F0F34E1|nr:MULTISPECIES: hypothetical protein [Streptomyces]